MDLVGYHSGHYSVEGVRGNMTSSGGFHNHNLVLRAHGFTQSWANATRSIHFATLGEITSNGNVPDRQSHLLDGKGGLANQISFVTHDDAQFQPNVYVVVEKTVPGLTTTQTAFTRRLKPNRPLTSPTSMTGARPPAWSMSVATQ